MSVPDPLGAIEPCTCSHPLDCQHGCHDHQCDPGEAICSIEFRPDDGGFTTLGCPECTPGTGAAHLADCPGSVGTAAISGRSTFGDSIQR